MKTGVALIGFMGTGKTAVGKLLAKKLNKPFVELDAMIEQRYGKSITEIFSGDGEIAFREREIAIVKEVSERNNQVIACGGGVVLNKINIDRLQKNHRIVCLTASELVILKRTAINNDRPLLDTKNRMQRIKELLKYRKIFYKQAADFTVNTSSLSIDAVANRITEKLRQDEGFCF